MNKLKHFLFEYLSGFLLDEISLVPQHCAVSSPNTAVVVQSFKGYERYWQGCFASLKSYFPRNLPIYLLTDNKNPLKAEIYERYHCIISPICTGTGSFALRGLRGLISLPSNIKYIVYLQEDMWIARSTEPDYFQNITKTMNDLRLKVVKICEGSFHPDDYSLVSCDNNKVDFGEGVVGYRFLQSRYLMSHHISIFERTFLTKAFALGVLFHRNKPFEHEVFISNVLAHKSMKCLNSSKPFPIVLLDRGYHVSYVHASEGGFLTAPGSKWLAKHDLSDDGHIFSRQLPTGQGVFNDH